MASGKVAEVRARARHQGMSLQRRGAGFALRCRGDVIFEAATLADVQELLAGANSRGGVDVPDDEVTIPKPPPKRNKRSGAGTPRGEM